MGLLLLGRRSYASTLNMSDPSLPTKQLVSIELYLVLERHPEGIHVEYCRVIATQSTVDTFSMHSEHCTKL